MKPLFLSIALLLHFCTFSFSQTCDLLLEDFTGSTAANPPTGWDLGPGGNIGDSFPLGDTLDPAVGFNNVGEYIITPPLTCPDSVCFLWHASGASSNWDVAIQYSQDTTGGGVWTELFVIDLTGSGSPNTYQELCLDVPNDMLMAPFGVYFRWIMIQRTSGTFYLDNVCINSGTCLVTPTKLTFQGVTNACKEVSTPISVEVCVTDENGFVAETFTGDIDLGVNSGPGTMSGTDILSAVSGCATFTVSFSAAGTYELGATADTFAGTSESLLIEDDCPLYDTLRVMSYNLLNFPNGRDDCGPENTVVPARWDTLKEIVDYAQIDVLMVCELQTEFGANMILSNALNTNGATNWVAATYVPNQSSVVQNLNNMFYYNSDKITMTSQDEILTGTRDFNKYTVFVNDPALASGADTTWIDFYMCHLKAGSASIDSQRRADDCLILRNYLDAQPAGRNFILGGDMNFYTDQEAAYQTLLSGAFPFNDPVNAPGAWDNNAAFANWHSQSSRPGLTPQWDCGFNGGLDSRFDFLLNSNPIQNGTLNVTYLPGTYQPFLNDGNLFNKGINDPANTSGAPMNVLDALFFMSDHLPIIEDLELRLQDIILAQNDLQLTLQRQENAVSVNWESRADQGEYYVLERSHDGIDFEEVVRMNKRSSGNYNYLDADLDPGLYFYRVQEVITNEKSNYSTVQAINLPVNLIELALFPNPVGDLLHIRLTGKMEGTSQISIINQVGQILMKKEMESSYDNWDIGDLAKGIYVVQLENERQRLRQKLIKL